MMNHDPNGNFAIGIFLAIAAILFLMLIGGVAAQVVTSAVSYAGMAIASIWDQDIRAVMNTIDLNTLTSTRILCLFQIKYPFTRGADF